MIDIAMLFCDFYRITFILDPMDFMYYDNSIGYEWDEGKNEQNQRKHGLSFENIEFADWEWALILPDARRDYGEARFLAYLPIAGRLHAVIYVDRGEVRRIISLRKANVRERKFYEKEA